MTVAPRLRRSSGTSGEPTPPRQAATVILLRGGADSLEVLLVKRNPEQRFMGGAWVFPGGAVDAAEGDDDDAHRLAGVREVEPRRPGVALPDPGALVRFSRWITPEAVKIRFDTHFFLVAAPEDADPQPDGSETVDLGWFSPQGAIEAHGRGEIMLVFPTMKTLEQLGAFALLRRDPRVGRGPHGGARRAAGHPRGRDRSHRPAGRTGLRERDRRRHRAHR